MGNPFSLALLLNLWMPAVAIPQDEQAHAREGEPGENLEPHRDAVPPPFFCIYLFSIF